MLVLLILTGWWEIKQKLKHSNPPFLLPSPASLTSHGLSTPEQCRGLGMGLCSVHNCFPHWSFPVTLSPSSHVGTSRATAPSGDLCVLQHGVLHRLQCGCLLPMVFFPWCRGSSSPMPGAHPPHFLQWPQCLQNFCSCIFSLLSLTTFSMAFFSLSSHLSAKMLLPGLWV